MGASQPAPVVVVRERMIFARPLLLPITGIRHAPKRVQKRNSLALPFPEYLYVHVPNLEASSRLPFAGVGAGVGRPARG